MIPDPAETAPKHLPRAAVRETVASLKETAGAVAMRTLFNASRAMPMGASSAMCGRFLRAQSRFSPLSAIARQNLRRAYPDLSSAEREAILARSWESLGRTFGEFSILDQMMESGRIESVGVDRYIDLLKRGKGLLVVSPHLSNWEAGVLVGRSVGLPVHVLYNFGIPARQDAVIRAIRAPRVLEQHLAAQRVGDTLRELLRAKQPVAAVLDEAIRGGLPVPFLGGTTRAPERPIRIAIQEGAPILLVHVERLEKDRLRVVVGKEFVPDRTLDVDANTRRIVKELFGEFERLIRRHPTQWIWFGKIWFD